LECGWRNQTWVQDCARNIMSSPGLKGDPTVLVNPANPANVVVGAWDFDQRLSDAKCTWPTIAVTHDKGATWTSHPLAGYFSDRKPGEAWFGSSCGYLSALAFGPDGTLYATLGLGIYGSNECGPLNCANCPQTWNLTPLPRLPASCLPFDVPVAGAGYTVLAVSHDGGDTWPAAHRLDTPGGLAVSPTTGTLLAVGTTNTHRVPSPANACQSSTSHDQGASFGPPQTFDTTTGFEQALCGTPFSFLSGRFGLPFVVENINPVDTRVINHQGTVLFATSLDDGATFSTPSGGFSFQPIPDQFQNASYTNGNTVAGSLGAADLFAAALADSTSGGSDILVRFSRDHGQTWTDPKAASTPAAQHRFMPAITIAPDGSIHAFYFEQAQDGQGRFVDLLHAWSLDQGASWQRERVTTHSLDAKWNTIPFYVNAASSAHDVWMAFPDPVSWNGTTEPYWFAGHPQGISIVHLTK
jgi:hypothetical protein